MSLSGDGSYSSFSGRGLRHTECAYYFMIPELCRIIPKISALFGKSPDSLHFAPIRHGSVERESVWRVTVDGQNYALKQHIVASPVGDSTFTPFEVESAVLSTLRDAGCSVPTIVWRSDADFCLLLDWRGESTLDDLAQAAPLESLNGVIVDALGGFCQIEKSFADRRADLAPYVYTLDYPAYLRHTMQGIIDRGRKTMGYLAQLCGAPTASDLDELWSNLAPSLHGNSGTLGALDYNARNIMVDANSVSFVDFGGIGWDWSERRIVQYFNSLGSNREGGNFINLLNQEVIGAYANRALAYRSGISEENIFVQLDYHNILFYLSVVHRLLEAVVQPTREKNRALLRTWEDAGARLARALEILVNSELSGDPSAQQIREWVLPFL